MEEIRTYVARTKQCTDCEFDCNKWCNASIGVLFDNDLSVVETCHFVFEDEEEYTQDELSDMWHSMGRSE